MKATLPSGRLVPIKDCYIEIPELDFKITMYSLPDVSDSKSASFADESAQGRSMPFKSYQNSNNRSISWTIHYMVCNEQDKERILQEINILKACTYPQNGNSGLPYAPPPTCRLRFGKLLSSKEAEDVCAVLLDYSIKYDITVPFFDECIPVKFDLDLKFDVIYNQANLPGSELIMRFGY